MKLLFSGAVLALLTLSGCSLENLAEKGVEQIYPDPERYVLFGNESSLKIKYACKKGVSKAETDSRVNRAHVFFDKSLEAFSVKQADLMLERMAEGDTAIKIAYENQRQTSAWAEVMREKMMENYQCFSYGSIDEE